jgi:phosphoadenosine phosphosulfate reductase
MTMTRSLSTTTAATGKVLEKEDFDLDYLNEVFTPLGFAERIVKLYEFFDEDEVLFTSSFGASAAFLLHLITQHRPGHPVYFIDTTYHFPETIAYKEELTRRLGLNVIDVLPDPTQNALTREEQWWKDHPKMCCSINKVVPLEPIKADHKVWISGLMGYQTDFRSNLRVFEQQGDILKFHPIVDLQEGDYLYWSSYFQLPKHPLEAEGYGSIGCVNCTVKGEGREGRWAGTDKKECGLHPGYFLKKMADKNQNEA